MNKVGNILVVLIFMTSVLFMGMASVVFMTHQNWKEEHGKVKGQLDQAQATNGELTTQRENLEKDLAGERTAKQQALAQLETRKSEWGDELTAMQKHRDELLKKDQDATAAVVAAQKNLARLTDEVEGLRREILAAQEGRDDAFVKVVNYTDALNTARAQLADAKERQRQLAAQYAKAKNMLEINDLDVDESADQLPAKVPGKIVAVDKKNQVEISLGRDDGLRVGHTLEVSRGSNYLGRIEIVHTTDDRAVARILPNFKQGIIRRGDNVDSRL